jgi:hypothetical protein
VSKIAAKDAKKIDEVQKDLNSIKMTSMAASTLFIHTGCAIFGDEWLPDTAENDEKAVLDSAFFEYFKEKDIKDFPVGVALTMAIVGYSAPRFLKPKPQTRTAQFKNKIMAKYFEWRGKKNGSHSSTRENGKRKIDTVKTVGETGKETGRIRPST